MTSRNGTRPAALAPDELPDADRARAILEERARLLAQAPPAEPKGNQSTAELVTFSLADERYAVEARYVREVARLLDLTPVPGLPEFFAGVVNQRGELLPVVELRRFFQLPSRGLTDLSRLVVLGLDRAELAILADRVDDLVTLPNDEVLEPAAKIPTRGRSCVRGVTREALIVLDAAALLHDERLFADAAGPENRSDEMQGTSA